MRISVSTEPISLERELAAFARGGAAGALASFVGYCRSEGGGVERLELEHYPALTANEIGRLADVVRTRHALLDLLIVHRVGAIPAGEAIVLVAALSEHRFAALSAVSEMMDYLKSEAPIWKKEFGPAGAAWIEPSERDYRAVALRRSRRGPHES